MTIIEEMMNVKDNPQPKKQKKGCGCGCGCSAEEVNAKESMPLENKMR